MGVNQRKYFQMKVKIQCKDGNKIINLNRRMAIQQKCLNCAGWIPKEVSKCDFKDCFLYPFRSGKGKQSPKKRERAIRDYCLWCMAGKKSEIAKCVSTDCSLFPFRLSSLDYSTEIKPTQKKGHIEAVSGNKTENEYQSADIA